MPEYVEPAVSPLSRPDIAAEFPLVLTNAKFTTFIHSQQRALPSLRKASPEPSADIHPETALRYRREEQRMDDRGKPARRNKSKGAGHDEYYSRRRLLPAWLVARVQRIGAAEL